MSFNGSVPFLRRLSKQHLGHAQASLVSLCGKYLFHPHIYSFSLIGYTTYFPLLVYYLNDIGYFEFLPPMVAVSRLKLKTVKVHHTTPWFKLYKMLCKACIWSLYHVCPLVPAAYHSVPVRGHRGGQLLTGVVSACLLFTGSRGQAQSVCFASMLCPKRLSSSSHAECISLAIIHFYDIFGLFDAYSSSLVMLFLFSKQQYWPWCRFWPPVEHYIFSCIRLITVV